MDPTRALSDRNLIHCAMLLTSQWIKNMQKEMSDNQGIIREKEIGSPYNILSESSMQNLSLGEVFHIGISMPGHKIDNVIPMSWKTQSSGI